MSTYNMLLNKRMTVVGDGPKRQKLPNFKLIGRMSKNFITETIQIAEEAGANYNDIFRMQNYGLAKQCKLSVGVSGNKVQETFDTKNTRHIMLQEPEHPQFELLEKGYTKAIPERDHILNHIKNFLHGKKEFYRSRISILHPNTNVPEHIDTNTSVSVRLNFIAQGAQEFFIERRGVIESKLMLPGDIYFINQGWKHWVRNLGSTNRIAILISCEWDALQPYFKFSETDKKWT